MSGKATATSQREPQKRELSREDVVKFADELDAAPCVGANEDIPEGSRVVTMSDTAAKRISQLLREIAGSE